jgi:hypothetical protein
VDRLDFWGDDLKSTPWECHPSLPKSADLKQVIAARRNSLKVPRLGSLTHLDGHDDSTNTAGSLRTSATPVFQGRSRPTRALILQIQE